MTEEELAMKAAIEDMAEEEEVKTNEPVEHDWYWIAPFSQKCSHCKVIKDVLFGNAKYRTRPTVDIGYEPKCYHKKIKIKNDNWP